MTLDAEREAEIRRLLAIMKSRKLRPSPPGRRALDPSAPTRGELGWVGVGAGARHAGGAQPSARRSTLAARFVWREERG
jgi:hypothetical protein